MGADGDPLAAEQRDGYEMALAEANADGGPAGCPLSLVYLPEQVGGSSNQVYQAVRSLVEEQEVIAVLGGTSSNASMLAATLINRFAVPMLIPNTSSMTALPENNFWTFRVSPNDEMYSRAVYEMVKAELGEERTVALLFEDTSAGHDAAVTAAELAGEQGMTVTQYSPLDSSQSATVIVAGWLMETPPDVLYLILNDPDQATELLQALSQAADDLPLTFLQGNGFVNRAFLDSSAGLPRARTGQMLAVTAWAAGTVEEGEADFQAEFARFTERQYGTARPATPHSAMAYNSLRILQMTIRSGSASWNGATVADVAAAREALRSDLQAYRENTPLWGSIAFTTGGQNQAEVFIQPLNAFSVQSSLPAAQGRRACVP
ncbi:amino acid ABC transporter substrate-binding protein, partial [bacterium]